MRLIDADALYDRLMYDTTRTDVSGGRYIATWRISDAIEEAPTIDEVMMVRCNDCQYQEPSNVRGRIWCKNMNRYMKVDGYCSNGERKDND